MMGDRLVRRVVCLSADGQRWYLGLALAFDGLQPPKLYGAWAGRPVHTLTRFSAWGLPVYRELAPSKPETAAGEAMRISTEALDAD